jgi:hypothetical protein
MKNRALILALRYCSVALLVAAMASTLFWRPLLGPRHPQDQAKDGSTVTVAGPVVALHQDGEEDLTLFLGASDAESQVVVLVGADIAGAIGEREAAKSAEYSFFAENYYLGPIRGDAGRAWFRVTGTLSHRGSVAEIRPHDADEIQKLSTWFSWPEATLGILAMLGILLSFRIGRRRSSEDA